MAAFLRFRTKPPATLTFLNPVSLRVRPQNLDSLEPYVNLPAYADDLPYWDTSHGKPQLIVPYAFDSNDMRFATAQGFNSGDQFFAYLKDSFDVLYREGDTRPRMMSIGLHCRLAGRPGRTAALERFLDYAKGHDRVWFARRIDIAPHWIATHPFGA